MRSPLRRLSFLDLELDPVTFLEVMNTPIEGQQELEGMIGPLIIHIISCHDILRSSIPVKRLGSSTAGPTASHRCSGAMSLMRPMCGASSSRLNDRCTRLAEGGRFATDRPGRHSVAGRMGRGAKPPPQFGQTLSSLVSTQSAQNVHS
jgi:hypothetical protein